MQADKASEFVSSLFETWAPALYRFACRESRSPLVAEDLVQEAFFYLYKELRNGRAIDNPKAWTTTVVQYQARKMRRELNRHGQLASFDLVATGTTAVADSNDKDAIAELLCTLSRREQEVLQLRLESLKYREIANRIGISAKSVATLLARALRKIQAARQSQPLPQELPLVKANARKPRR